MQVRKGKVISVLLAAFFCLAAPGQSAAASSVRVRPIPVRTTHIYVHNHNSGHDEFVRAAAITAVALGVVAIIAATRETSACRTGHAGYDRYLREKCRVRN